MNHLRSLLFVPANNRRFIGKASSRGSDAIILDLEDSVPDGEKTSARSTIAATIEELAKSTANIGVRINRSLLHATADLSASVHAGLDFIMIPKVHGNQHVQLIDEMVTELETERGLPPGRVRLMALVETLEGLAHVEDIAQSSLRLSALALGSEDLATDGGFEPNEETLTNPCQRLSFAARRAGLDAYGFPGSVADYGNPEHFRNMLLKARGMGFGGALCIHPSQVATVNNVFKPSESDIRYAQEVIARYECALSQNKGVAVLDGKMIDLPVVNRARAILDQS